MHTGDEEPVIVPSLGILRQAKYESVNKARFDNDPVIIAMAKYTSLCSDFIKDFAYDKFSVHFWSSAQVHAERLNCSQTAVSSISIDASGKLVKPIT